MSARVHVFAVCVCMCTSSTARVRLFMRMHSHTNEHASSTIRSPSPRPKVRYVASARHHQRDSAVFRKLHHTGKHSTPCPLPLSLSPATCSHIRAACHSCPCLRPPPHSPPFSLAAVRHRRRRFRRLRSIGNARPPPSPTHVHFLK